MPCLCMMGFGVASNKTHVQIIFNAPTYSQL